MDGGINMSTTLTVFTLVYYVLFLSYLVYYKTKSSGIGAVWDFFILLIIFGCIVTSLTNYYINYYNTEQDKTIDIINIITTVLIVLTLIGILILNFVPAKITQPV